MPYAVAAAVVGAGASVYAGNKAADAQSDAADRAMQAQREGNQQSLSISAPYRIAAEQELMGFQSMIGSEGRVEELNKFYQGPEYRMYQGLAEDAILRNKSMTGGMRSGGTQAALAGIAPDLGQQFIQNKMTNQMSLINVGQGFAGRAASEASQLGFNQAQLLQDQGAYQSGKYLNQGEAVTNLAGSLAGIYKDKNKVKKTD